jgi:hypothetical protein
MSLFHNGLPAMSRVTARLCAVLVLSALVGCTQPSGDYAGAVSDPDVLHGAFQTVTDVMIESVTSPPVASRTYAYSSIAAYEALRHGYPDYRSLADQVNGLETVPAPDPDQEYLLPLSAAVALLTVSEALVFDPQPVAQHRDSLVQQMRRQGAPRNVVDRSVAYGAEVAAHILAWAGNDGIKTARSLERFVVGDEPGRWRPTPPAHMQAIEAHWGTLRPFTLDSASQFRPAPPIPFSADPRSAFHKEVQEVIEVSRSLTDEQREIAAFWDCNPYALKAEGHIMFAVKKITPAGHWMGITKIAARQAGADMMRTAEAYAYVGMTLADGFISTWEEKFRSNLVRPETVINDALDRDWRPLLQTPPFPEYPSGHSVISTATGEVLTALFGDGFAYSDDTEVPFGLPIRSFTSFRAAAAEAAMSRLYGGIHYRMGIEHGVTQGRAVGQNVVARVQTRASGIALTD